MGSAALEAESDAAVPLEHQRFLTEGDFERIRELRQQQMVDAAMAKHGLKSAAKRAKHLAAAQDDADAALLLLVGLPKLARRCM